MKDKTGWMILPGFVFLGLLSLLVGAVVEVDAEKQASITSTTSTTATELQEPQLRTGVHLDHLVNAYGKCSIDQDGHLKLEQGVTQDACLKFVMISMLNDMADNGERCAKEKRMILDAWDKTLHPAAHLKKR